MMVNISVVTLSVFKCKQLHLDIVKNNLYYLTIYHLMAEEVYDYVCITIPESLKTI